MTGYYVHFDDGEVRTVHDIFIGDSGWLTVQEYHDSGEKLYPPHRIESVEGIR